MTSQTPSERYTSNLYNGINLLARRSHHDSETSNVVLSQAAVSVSQSLQELAKIQRSVHNIAQVKEDPSLLKIDIKGNTSIDWTGPVESILSKIAVHTKHKFVTFGTKPAIPIIISLNKQDISIADLVRDIAYSVQRQASVVYKNNKLELRYY
ncbi:MAG: DotD/TraH family lipoprotein [Pseudomonadota bacterium]|nr:DotD/TraH family lipoprotein [Pseudomonadota bacterium]